MVEIARAPEEVFAFVTDPAKLSAWQDAVDAVRGRDLARLRPGATPPLTLS